MAITSIRSFRNLIGGETYGVRNNEESQEPLIVASGEAKACNMRIPWCNNQGEFDKNHYIISAPYVQGTVPARFAIWQEGDYVRYSRDSFFKPDGNLVPGNCTVGGDRSVEIVGTNIYDADLRFF